MDVRVILNQIYEVEDYLPVGGNIDTSFLSVLTPQMVTGHSERVDETWYGYIENGRLVQEALTNKFIGTQIPAEPNAVADFYKIFVLSRLDVMSNAIVNFITQNYKTLIAEHYLQTDLEGINSIKTRLNLASITGATIQFYLNTIIRRCLDEFDLSLYMSDVIYNNNLKDVIYSNGAWECIKLNRNSYDIRLVNALYDKVSMKTIGILFEM